MMKRITLSLVAGLLLAGSANLSAQNWVNGGNTLGSSGRIGTNNAQTVIFETGNNEQGRVTPAGQWGFGTTAPSARVHVNALGSQDAFRVQASGSTRLLINNAGNLGIGTSSPSSRFHVNRGDGANTNLALFSNSATTGDRTALIDIRNGNNVTWRYGVGGTGNGLGITNGQFYIERAGLGAALTINTVGKVGINTTNPDEYMLKIKQHTSYGLNIESPTGDDWEQWVDANGDLVLWANGVTRGAFRIATGAYSAVSDERAKTDIQPMTSILDKINQLKPTTYHFKADGSASARADSPLEYGFIAQDVEKVFPSLVSHHVVPERNVDTYTLNYSGFGSIAIKGIQELQQTVQDQRQEISSLEARLATLETAIKALTVSKLVGQQLTDKKPGGVVLEQNHPNNFNQSTTIRYTIPGDANAFILLFDNEGNLVKSVKAPATGQVELNASSLKTGVYIYTLMVNGEPAASKRLMVAK